MLVRKPTKQLVLGEFTHHVYTDDDSILDPLLHLVNPDIGINWPKEAPYWDIHDSFPGTPVAIDRRVVGKHDKYDAS